MGYTTRPSLRTGFVLFSMWSAVVLATPGVRADVLVNDHFDDGVLDPTWQVVFEYAYGWTYEESGTNLTVTDIDPEVINAAGGGTWAVVSLNQAFSETDDFHVDFDFSWDSEGDNKAMQRLTISLLDGSGGTVVGAGLSDPWLGSRACQWALIGASYQCEPNQLPHAGTAAVDIDRTDDQVAILWNGTPIMNDVLSTPVEGVEIIFSFYAYEVSIGSFFGTESLDRVSIEGTPTAVEARSWGSVKDHFRAPRDP
jgi:hypothetical protein